MFAGPLVPAAAALVPVLLFLAALQFMDTFKLVHGRRIIGALSAGAAAALLSYGVNTIAFGILGANAGQWAYLGAPLVEELAKAAYVMFLIATARVAFMVDAAICGFAVGAGFAVIENAYYLHLLSSEPVSLAVLRGVGTAVMHGGVTAIAAILAILVLERFDWRGPRLFAPGLAIAVAIHSFFNLGLLSPATATVVMIVGLPLLLSAVFIWSERALHRWLHQKMDQDIELLDSIATGNLLHTRSGAYLQSLQHSFPPETRGDMLCMLQLTIELSVRAKGELLLREAGLDVPADPNLDNQFRELAYLEKSIGRTGMLAVKPLLSQTPRDLWELHLLARGRIVQTSAGGIAAPP